MDFDSDHISGGSDESDPLASDSGSLSSNREAREEIFGPDIDTLIAETQNKGSRRRKRRFPGQAPIKRRPQWDIPPHLVPVMGAATMAYVDKDFEKAISSLERIIREAPKAAAPHRTLGLIYEDRGERRKALDCYMIAANLDKRECDLWKRNSVLWEEEGDLNQAIACLNRAIKVSGRKDRAAFRARAEYRVRQGHFKKAADNYAKLYALDQNDIEVLKKLVALYKKTELYAKAIQVLESSIEYFQQGFPRRDGITSVSKRNLIVMDLVQALVEIWFKQKRFSESSALLGRVKDQFSSSGSPMTFEMRLLLAICQHRLGADTLASPTLIEFMSSPSMMEKYENLLWEVADACLDSGDFRKGEKAYNILEKSGRYENDIRLYLNRASCHKELNNLEKCKADLLAVIRIKPRHMEASMKLVQFFPEFAREKREAANRRRRLRRREKLAPLVTSSDPAPPGASLSVRKASISAVGHDYLTKGTEILSGITTSDNILVPVSFDDIRDALALLSRADRAFAAGDFLAFLSIVGPPIESALHLTTKIHRPNRDDQSDDEEDDADDGALTEIELLPATNSGLGKTKPAKKRARASKSGTASRRAVPQNNEERNGESNEIGVALLREVDESAFTQLLEHIFEALVSTRRVDDIEPIMSALLAIAAVRIGPDSPFKLRMQALLVISLFATGRYYESFSKLRSMIIQNPEDPRICCLFAIAEEHVATSVRDSRFKYFRALDRLLKKHSQFPILTYINGLCSARGVNNSHNYTVGKFLQTYAHISDSPLLCLCLVVQFVYVAQNRRVGNRNQIVLYALAFLDEYRRLRRRRSVDKCAVVVEQEMLYNAGRTMHQLGILHMAEELYKSVLQLKVGEKGEVMVPPWADLRRDAAYNLVRIYSPTCPELARDLTLKYLVF